MKIYSKPVIYKGTRSLYDFQQYIIKGNYSSVVVLVDKNTEKYCYPTLEAYLEKHILYSVAPGEENKTINTCMDIWEQLSEANIDRKAVIVNVGGGVLCDIGGFIASTYKRGIDFINIPTTLLAMCDASLGGKSAVNIKDLKNQVGVFKNPKSIVIFTDFLETLPEKQFLSGYSEIIKHSLIGNIRFFNELYSNVNFKSNIEYFIDRSIKIKSRIVNLDSHEKGLRKSLNFGHSIGHALESYFFINHPQKIISHGEAIALGIIAESWISMKKKFLSDIEFNQICKLILKLFPKIEIEKKDFPKIIDNIMKDKKNENNNILFTLLNGIGQFRINEIISNEDIVQSLEYYNSL